MIAAGPSTTSKWPIQQASAYADWWLQTDLNGGAHDSAALHLRHFQLAPADPSGAPRFVPVAALPGPDVPHRTLPIWAVSDSLGQFPGQGNGHGHNTQTPITEFGAPLTAQPTCPAVMVVIDTAINPLHEQFRNGQNGTRILAHWVMDGAWRNDQRVHFGRELRQGEVNAAIAANNTEDRALRALGLLSFAASHPARATAQTFSHGTHVLGLAAGTAPTDQTAEAMALRSLPILAVSLPSDQIMSASGVFLDLFADQALSWVSQRLAEAFGTTPPAIIVNLSYGLTAGPKDATGYLNRRLQSFLSNHPGAKVFMPAGNDGKDHAHAFLSSSDPIGWLVPPSDPLSTFAEVWFPAGHQHATLLVSPPSQPALEIMLGSGGVYDLAAPGQATPIGRVYDLGRDHPTGRLGALICLAPTLPYSETCSKAPAGVWKIGLKPGEDTQARVSLQSKRHLTAFDSFGHPARLIALAEIAPHPQRNGTLNAIGPGTGATVINGLDQNTNALALWTSKGDATAQPPIMAQPTDADGPAFPADRSRANPGIPAPGYRSGSRTTVQGTSFSTALASRAAIIQAMGPSV